MCPCNLEMRTPSCCCFGDLSAGMFLSTSCSHLKHSLASYAWAATSTKRFVMSHHFGSPFFDSGWQNDCFWPSSIARPLYVREKKCSRTARQGGRNGLGYTAVRLLFDEETSHADVGTDCLTLICRQQQCSERGKERLLPPYRVLG
jgi:hypothetical protein